MTLWSSPMRPAPISTRPPNRSVQMADGAARRKATGCCSCIPRRRWSRAGKRKWNPSSPRRCRNGPAPRSSVLRWRISAAKRAAPKPRRHLRAGLLALPYGDQGLLIPKRLYQKLGGYRALADMEDADLVRRIGRRRLVRLRARAVNLARPQQSVCAALRFRCCTLCAFPRGCWRTLYQIRSHSRALTRTLSLPQWGRGQGRGASAVRGSSASRCLVAIGAGGAAGRVTCCGGR